VWLLLVCAGSSAVWLYSGVPRAYEVVVSQPWSRKLPTPISGAAVKRYAAEIDQLVDKNLQRSSHTAQPGVSDEVFLRRVYLDITGRIPDHRAVAGFVNSTDINKRARLINELLDSNGYVSHFFHYWADLLRHKSDIMDYWSGVEYAQWIKDSLKDNKPFDQFTFELLTASGHAFENGAIGYRQRDGEMLFDNAAATVRLFLGTRMECAECHDHPFDSLTRREFYEMAAFFSETAEKHTRDPQTRGFQVARWLARTVYGTRTPEETTLLNGFAFATRGLEDRAMTQDSELVFAEDYQYEDASPGSPVEPATFFGEAIVVARGQTRREALARWIATPDNPRFSRVIANRLWKKVMGTGLIEPVDDLNKCSEATDPDLLDLLTQIMVDVEFDMKSFLQIMYNTKTYQRSTILPDDPSNDARHYSDRVLRRLTAEQIWDSLMSLVIPDLDQRRGHGSAILNSREKLERLSHMSPFEFRRWQSDGNECDARDGLEDGRITAPLLPPDQVAGGRRPYWTWDESGIVDPRWSTFPRDYVLASELESPAPASHFLRTFGQSDRNFVGAAHTNASVTQALALLNEQVHEYMWHEGAVLKSAIDGAATVEQKTNIIFRAIVSRPATTSELVLASKTISEFGDDGLKMISWALINSPEFLFVQ